MKLIKIYRLQSPRQLLNNSIVVEDEYTRHIDRQEFSYDTDQFLCKHRGRYFVSTLRIVEQKIYVDNVSVKAVYELSELEAIYLIHE